MDSRAVALAALSRILAGADTEPTAREALRQMPWLDNAGRALWSRRIIGTAVLRLRLGWLAGSSDAAPLLDEYVQSIEGSDPGDAARLAEIADPFERLSLSRSCPAPLLAALLVGRTLDQADAFLARHNEPGPVTLRANTLWGSRDDVARALADEGITTTPVDAVRTALQVKGHANLFGSATWKAGAFEVQDAGSQAIALATAALPGMTVVDLCAGRGGKTLALAAMMKNEGRLFVHDTDARALRDMQPRLKRAGVTCVQTGLPDQPEADVVLVDAPCSNTGVLRRWPDLRYRFTADTVPPLVELQRALLDKARTLVGPRGTVVYATCSALHDENAAVALTTSVQTDDFYCAALTDR